MMEFNIGIAILGFFGLLVYLLIVFVLIEKWVMVSWNESVTPEMKQDPSHRLWLVFSKICCLIWPIGVPLFVLCGILWLTFFDFGDK